MRSKPPLASGKEIVNAFLRIGYHKVSQKGSHIKIKNYETEIVLIIPNHKEVDRWTLKTILKAAAISAEQFAKLLK